MKQTKIEQFYDYYDGIASLLYEEYKLPYIEGMNEAFNLLLDDELEGSYKEEDILKMKQQKEQITEISFEREEIRKSVQLGMLKGYKHTFSSNALITPDTIGIFLAYVIKKLYQKRSLETIFDPFVGSGNLLYSVANQLEQSPRLYGIDTDILKCQLARNLGDLLDYHNEMFYQDSLTFIHQGFDVCVMDVPLHEEGTYMPFQYINHHILNVVEGGYLFALIENDFFEQEQSAIFREEIQKHAHVFGLIKLPESMFTQSPQSILILRRTGENVQAIQDFMLVDLPSFNDMQGMDRTIRQIDAWIANREDEIL